VTARTLDPFDPEVVAPWRLGDGPRGALLVHGFASTPPELRRLGEALAAQGFRCHAPSLPGHGTTPEDLERTRWQDWAAAVQDAFNTLAAECSEVVVAGQSMGGTLALHLAARDPRVRAVATLAAPIWLPGPLPPLLPILTRVVRWHHTGSDIDLWHPDAVEELHSYGIRPTRSINELRRVCAVVRNELAEVRAPVFVLHGERDRTIDPRCAREIAQRLINSEAVQLRMLPRSGHAISVDVDREVVNADILRWFERFAPAEQVAASR
jgi:carboxylesterase